MNDRNEICRRTGNRVWYLDWLRAFACLAVVLIHCLTIYLDNTSVAEVGEVRAIVWTEIHVVFARWAVPVFLMITGALLLDPNRNIGWVKVRGYVARMAVVLVVFGTFFALMELVFSQGSFKVSMIAAAVVKVFQGESWSHLWYLYDLIGIYLLLPILRAFVARCGERDYWIALGILFVCSLVLPTINSAIGLSLETFVWLGFSVFYVLLGWYLRAFDVSIRIMVPLGIACLVAVVVVAGGGVVMTGGYQRWSWEPASPFIAIWATALFVAAKRFVDRPLRKGGVFETLASLSFAVYLLHPVFANLLYKALDWGPKILPPGLFEIVTYAVVLFGALAAALVVKRLPLIGRCL